MFSSLYWGFPGLVVIALQVFFAVHAIRTGRGGWVLLIVLFPLVGSLIYLFTEYLPDARRGRSGLGVDRVKREVARRINPEGEIRRLEEVAELTPTVNNRMALARGYLAAGRVDDAVRTYEGCAQGIFADDTRLLYELTMAYHAQESFAKARESFDRLRAQGPLMTEQLLLGARIYEGAGDDQAALREYAALSTRGGGEARVRYALLLKKLGRMDEAYALFDQVVRQARVTPPSREEKPWVETARRELQERETERMSDRR
ncbi:MAG TPA: hypothetical protein VFQ39_18500 [Longimicrobium sp.]|nr:hypothetical protein [Longimicrobium sp.]